MTDLGDLGPLISHLGRFFLSKRIDPDNVGKHWAALFEAAERDYGEKGAHFVGLFAAGLNERTSNVQINISGGQIGNLNTGEQVGTITGSVHILSEKQDKQSQDLASALKYLTEAIHESKELTDDQKRDNLDILATLATAAQEPPEKRSKGVLKTIVTGLGAAVSVAKPLAELWQTWGPAVRAYFGIP